MRFTAGTLLPTGDFLAHAGEWTGLPQSELLGLMRGSAEVSSGGSEEMERLKKAFAQDPAARELLASGGDPAQVLAGDTATPEQIAKIRASLGLDEPPHLRFARWLWHVVQGDLGASIFSGEPVTHMIGQRLQPTFSLLLIAVVISIAIGVPFGVAAAARRGGFVTPLIVGGGAR